MKTAGIGQYDDFQERISAGKQLKEQVIEGVAASPGIILGVAYVINNTGAVIPKHSISPDKVEMEVEHFRRALNKTRMEIRKVREVHSETLGTEPTRIFDAHLLVLDDVGLIKETENNIRKLQRSAAAVFAEVIDRFISSFAKHPDTYFRERQYDLEDLRNRIIGYIIGQETSLQFADLPDDAVIITSRLTPSQTINLQKEKVKGIAVEFGGVTSHAMILSKSLGIPALTQLRKATKLVQSETPVILDGNNGVLICSPSRRSIKRYLQKMESFQVFIQDLSELRLKEAITSDGFNIRIAANVDLPEELASVKAQGASGIGLFRSEYLYIREGGFPSEEDQFKSFKNALELVDPDEVTIRLFDLGGDKIEGGGFHSERNPFLGLRGVRYLLSVPEQLRIHLKAILRASVFGKLCISIPMVTRIDEVREVLEVYDEIIGCLERDGIDYDPDCKIGVLVETPSAALISGELAKYVDFLSVGSNDLTMYTLATDRENSSVVDLFQHFDPSVLRLIRLIVDSGIRNNIEVGVCGEMAANPLLIPFLTGLGLDFLSVTPSVVPEAKKIIRSITFEDSRALAKDVLELHDYRDIKRVLGERLRETLPWLQA